MLLVVGFVVGLATMSLLTGCTAEKSAQEIGFSPIVDQSTSQDVTPPIPASGARPRVCDIADTCCDFNGHQICCFDDGARIRCYQDMQPILGTGRD